MFHREAIFEISYKNSMVEIYLPISLFALLLACLCVHVMYACVTNITP